MSIPSTLDLEMAFLDACFKKEGFAITENGTVLNTADELAEVRSGEEQKTRVAMIPGASYFAARFACRFLAVNTVLTS